MAMDSIGGDTWRYARWNSSPRRLDLIQKQKQKQTARQAFFRSYKGCLKTATCRLAGVDYALKEILALMHCLFHGAQLNFLAIIIGLGLLLLLVLIRAFCMALRVKPPCLIITYRFQNLLLINLGFGFIGQIPKYMLTLVPTSSSIMQEYHSNVMLHYPQIDVYESLKKAKHMASKIRKAQKTPPTKKPKKVKCTLHDEDEPSGVGILEDVIETVPLEFYF
ncbi:hypothetical protein L1887_31682 [Cichorium endivia]|nr:hypothetical protein L1887_31682 [Cichorium endivia]